MTPDLKAMQKALWVAKRVAQHVDPGFSRVPLPTPGEPIPLQHAAGGRVGKAGGGAQGDGQTPPLPGFTIPSATTRPLNNIGLYSHAAEQAAALQQKKGSGQQMLASLKGVKPDELKWSGAQAKFGSRPSVTRDELAQHFRDNLPPIEEHTLGEGAVAQPQGPAHLSPEYPHLVTHNDWEGAMSDAAHRGDFGEHANLREAHANFLRSMMRDMPGGSLGRGRSNDTQYEQYTVPGGENYRETILKRPDSAGAPEFTHSHWSGIENPVVHIRKKDRQSIDGRHLLHLEELQSDWAQQGHEKDDKGNLVRGFKPEGHNEELKRLHQALRSAQADKDLASARFENVFHDNEHPDYARLADNQLRASNAHDAAEEAYFRHQRQYKGAVTPAPYVTKMEGPVDLGLKHALTEAAHNGYHGLTWSTGDQNNDHYPGTVRRAETAEYRPRSHTVNIRDGHDREVQSIPLPPAGEDADYAAALRPHLGDEVAEMMHDRIHEFHTPHFEHDEEEHGSYDPEDWVEPPSIDISHLGIQKGGQGLRNHYDKLIPQRVAALMKEHDPDAKVGMVHSPEDPDDDTGDVHLFHHIPITEKARQSIIKNGFKAYRRGGEVGRASKAGGGEIDDDLKAAQAQGADTSSIPAIREAGKLQRLHTSFMGDVRERAQEAAQKARELHESGALPFAVGTRFHTPHSRERGDPPYEVTGHYYSNHRGREQHGYFYKRDHGPWNGEEDHTGGEERGQLITHDPVGDAQKRKLNPDWDRDAHVAQWQPLGGLRRVKNKGGSLGEEMAANGNTSQAVTAPEHEVSTQSLAHAFNTAINHHVGLPIHQRALNSRAVAERIKPFVGTDPGTGRPKPLLTSNAKLVKAKQGYEAGMGYEGQEPILMPDGRGVETVGLPLSPAAKAGKFKVCPNSKSCEDVCLGKTSGNYGASYAVNWPRINSARKTNAMLHDPEAFAVRLHDEITQAKMQAGMEGNKLAVRLNTLSDLDPKVHEALIKTHPDVDFYDYTKMAYKPIAPNHHYTYSSTGLTQPPGYNGIEEGEGVHNPHQNWRKMRNHLDNGSNVAMVFSHPDHLPHEVHDEETGRRYRVVDGTTHDYRPLDAQPPGSPGVVVGLRNLSTKGKRDRAHIDSQGFIVRHDPQLLPEINERTGKPTGKPLRGPSPGKKANGTNYPGPTYPQNHVVIIPKQPDRRFEVTRSGKNDDE